jgi:prepilin signal peptidase PulO-like enzyme (type II secretory pathway)
MSDGIGIASAALTGIVIALAAIWASDLLPRLSASARSHQPDRPCASHLFGSQWRWLHGASLLVSAGFAAYLWARFGETGQSLLLGGLYGFLLLITLIDLKYRLVLNLLTYPALALTLAVQAVTRRSEVGAALVGAALAFSMFFLAALLRPGDLGGGDVKLAALIGLWFGFPSALWALLVGVGLGGAAAASLALAARRDGRTQPGRIHLPYAPFLCLGALAALLYNPVPGLLP